MVRELKSLKISKQLVSKTIIRYKELNTLENRPKSGRPRSATLSRNIKCVRARIQRNPCRSSRKMAAELGISDRSIRRILKQELGCKAYKKTTGQFLSTTQKKNRLVRCRRLKTRLANNKHEQIVFTDEKLFSVEQILNRQNNRVWEAKRKESLKTITRRQGAPGVMVWAGVTTCGRTPLIFIEKGIKINAKVYLDNVLKNTVKPLAEKQFPTSSWIFQQDSAPSHKAKIVQQWCKINFPDFITSDEWPSASPDLNPMDYTI